MLKNSFKKLLPYLKNKYVITILAVFIWMLFFDRNDLFTQYSYWSQLDHLKQDKEYYIEGLKEVKEDLNELMTNKKTLEKFAREKYFMKKPKEDIFVLVKED